jgi:hypothetical protein
MRTGHTSQATHRRLDTPRGDCLRPCGSRTQARAIADGANHERADVLPGVFAASLFRTFFRVS